MTLSRNDVAQRHDLDPRAGSGSYRSLTDPSGPTYSSTTLTKLGVRQPNVAQPIGGDLIGDEETTTFCVWAFELDDVVPKVGDRIVDADNVVWAVRGVDHRIQATRYYCHCVRMFGEV